MRASLLRQGLLVLACVGVGFTAGWFTRAARAPGPPRAGAAVIAEVSPTPRVVPPPSYIPEGPFPNLLLLVADDVGRDMIGAYDEHPDAPPTPHIDALAAEGLLFRHAVANPVCSPTRATLLTGRYAWRYGVGNAIPPRPGWALPATERLLPVSLREGTGGRYRSAMVGKWHLASPTVGGYDHPRKAGFDHHVGTMGNLLGYADGEPQTYFHWQRVVDGQPGVAEGYVTSATVDDALRLAQELPEPWFLMVGFHAAHFPMHAPPAHLVTTPLPENPSEAELYRAMVEALDTEIGRLLGSLPADVRARTDVVFMGDNGSASPAILPPWPKTQGKGELTRGGIEVPFIVAGPDVAARGATDALINTSDLYATVLDLLDVDEPWPEDSVSFAPILADPDASSPRKLAYAERFGPNGLDGWTYHEAAIQDDRYKLVLQNGKEVGFYDLRHDPLERRSLFRRKPTPEIRTALRRLRAGLPDVAKVERSGRRAGDDDDAG